MTISSINNKYLIAAAFGMLLILLITSGIYPLSETSEARYAEISREMYLNGDFLHPKLLGIYHYHKPPITYWITAIGYSIFGVNKLVLGFS
jgi:4-amino-4-deoxy-L-arabinose transferase